MEKLLGLKVKKRFLSLTELITMFSRVASFLIYAFSFLGKDYVGMLFGILLFFSCNILYCLENLKSRFLFLIFNFTLFVFLIGRPTIDIFKGQTWYKYNDPENLFSLNSIYISLIFLWIGSFLGEKILISRNEIVRRDSIKIEYKKVLANISLILFYVSMAMLLVVELEKFRYMRGKNYEEIYVSFKTHLPFFVNFMASMCKYFLCIFLSTMPSKRKSFIPLMLYIVSSAPYFLIGARYKLVINTLFVVVYYLIREVLENKGKWVGKFEKTVFILGMPIALAFLGAYNYIREGKKVLSGGAVSLIIDFFYKQGVSFEVLKIGYNVLPKIKYTGFVNYSFGEILDYVFHGNLAQILFGAESLGNGQNVTLGLYSNLFANRMAYTASPEYFLAGHGWGSSYLLDTYADWGYVGIIVFSLILGIIFSLMVKTSCKSIVLGTIVLTMLTNIYYCPRSSAFSFISFIVYVQFYVPFIICFGSSLLFLKKYSLKRQIMSKNIAV